MSHHFTHRKRKSAAAAAEPAWDAGIELQDLRAAVDGLEAERASLHSSFNGVGLYDMRTAGDRARLAQELWLGDYEASMVVLRESNSALVTVLEHQIQNASMVTEHLETARRRHVDGILLDISRARNQNLVPVLTAATSILGEFSHTSREFHDAIALYHRGAVPSDRWVRDFLVEASAMRPVPDYPMIEGVAVTVFDNLSMKIDYSSYSTEGETGRKLDMTNWLSTRVPASNSPHMDANKLCARCAAMGLQTPHV